MPCHRTRRERREHIDTRNDKSQKQIEKWKVTKHTQWQLDGLNGQIVMAGQTT